jgi:hypothetical protein
MDFTFAWTKSAGIHQAPQLLNGLAELVHSFAGYIKTPI